METTNYIYFIGILIVLLFLSYPSACTSLFKPNRLVGEKVEPKDVTHTDGSALGAIVYGTNSLEIGNNNGIKLNANKTALNLATNDVILSAGTTAATERVRILGSNGYVGIGKSNPATMLDVNGDIKANNLVISGNFSTMGRFGIGTSTPQVPLHVVGTTSTTLLVSDKVGIGVTNPSVPLQVQGQIVTSNLSVATFNSSTNLDVYESMHFVGKEFKVGGTPDKYYPVIVDAGFSYITGKYEFCIARGYVHLDEDWHGSMNLCIEGKPYYCGHAGNYMKWRLTQRPGGPVKYRRMVAGMGESYCAPQIIVWLLGATTYFFTGKGCKLLNANSSGIALTGGDGAALAIMTAVEPYLNADVCSGDNLTGVYSLDWRMGIGISSPRYPLSVNCGVPGANDNIEWRNDSYQLGWIGYSGGNNRGAIGLLNDGIETTRIRAYGPSYFTGGVVGIGHTDPTVNYYGTAIPNSKLVVYGGSLGQAGGTARISIGGDTRHYAAIEGKHIGNGSTTLSFWTCNGVQNYSNPYERMTINQDGFVGIGTNSPSTSLHVHTTNGNGLGILTGRYYLSGPGDNQGEYGPWYGLGYCGASGLIGLPCLAGYYGLVLRTGAAYAHLSQGGLGINKTNPEFTLDVSGNLRVTSSIHTPDWIYSQGSNGFYWSAYSRGLISPEGIGNPYGTVSAYGSGRSGWTGYGLLDRYCFMTNTSGTGGLHDNSYSWLVRWEGTSDRAVYVGGSVRCSVGGDRLLVFANSYDTGSGYFYYNYGNAYGVASDRRIKTNLQPIYSNQSVEFIKRIEPTSFCLKSDEKCNADDKIEAKLCCDPQDGFIAQNILDACNKTGVHKSVLNNLDKYEEELNLPDEERKTILGVSDRPILSHTVNVVKHLLDKVDRLEEENQQLKSTVSSLLQWARMNGFSGS
jgi:Chaperone of endosialidase